MAEANFAEFQKAAAQLEQLGDRKLVLSMRRDLRALGKPVGDAMIEAIAGAMPKRGGLAERVRSQGRVSVLINLRNLMQLFVCADRRYGPTYNMGTAGEIHRSLVRHGHRPGSDDEVVLLGWSGGGQIALGAAWYLEAMGLKVSVLSLGGMLSDDIALARIDHLWHLYGTKDFLQASGKLLFAGRWPAAKKSPWNEALAQGKISMIELGPYNHNVKEHYFDYESKLPSGTSYAGHVIDTIEGILEPQA